MEAFAFVYRFTRVNTLFTLLVLFAMWNTVSGRWMENLYCLDGKHHKSAPSPEPSLHDQCSPWKSQSCCTYNTTERIHNFTLYNLNYSHCQPLSESCKKHFIRDLCFYECSPDVGPWVVKVEGKKTRKERFKNVPLCRSECDNWFYACRNDFVCSRNWIKDGTRCPNTSQCATIKDTYHNAENFCEEIFDYSWKYTPDDEPCMKMWYDLAQSNPNGNSRTRLLFRPENDSHWPIIGASLAFFLLVSLLFLIFRCSRELPPSDGRLLQNIPFSKMRYR